MNERERRTCVEVTIQLLDLQFAEALCLYGELQLVPSTADEPASSTCRPWSEQESQVAWALNPFFSRRYPYYCGGY